MREVFVAVVYTPDDNRWTGFARATYEEAEADLPGLLERASEWYLREPPPKWMGMRVEEWRERAKDVYGEVQKRFYMD